MPSLNMLKYSGSKTFPTRRPLDKILSLLADHLTYFHIFSGKFLMTFLVISPQNLSQHFPVKNTDDPFKSISQIPCIFQGRAQKKFTISICTPVSDSHQKISKFTILVAAHQADVRGPLAG